MPHLADSTGPKLEIDLGQLLNNWQAMAARGGGVACAAVVKADAYGLGVSPVSAALAGAGCETFFVATAAEAVMVRAQAPEAAIYVLNGPYGPLSAYIDFHLRPVISSVPMLEYWQQLSTDEQTTHPVAMHIDTGMNRLGFSAEEWQSRPVQTARSQLPVALVMSHLACADENAHPLTPVQLERFADLTDGSTPRSLANSAGIIAGADYHFDLLRPGIALYGAAIGDVHPALSRVVRATTSVLMTRTVRKGEAISYGATYRFDRDSEIAIVEIGYGDGFIRSGSAATSAPGGAVLIKGEQAPIVGRITMDMTMVDVSDIPNVAAGEPVELFGDGLSIDQAASAAGTISYELLTRLGSRYRRHYVGEGV